MSPLLKPAKVVNPDAEAAPPDPKFPRVKITGGPTSRNTEVFVNGEKQLAVREVEVKLGVGEAHRVILTHFAHLDIDIEAGVKHTIAVQVVEEVAEAPTVETGEGGSIRVLRSVEKVRGEGATLKAALLDAASKLED